MARSRGHSLVGNNPADARSSALAILLRKVVAPQIAKRPGRLLDIVAAIVGPLFVLGLFLWYVNDGLKVICNQGSDPTQFLHQFLRADRLFYWLLWLVILLVAYIVADLNSWSAHPFYRRLLASAYCLKRLSPTECVEVPYETVTSLSDSQPQAWRTSAGPDASARPELVVCAAANLSDRGLVPPGRLGASFAFTPSVIGGAFGEAGSEKLENDLGPVWQKDITLMASVATSGAAFGHVPQVGGL